MKNRRVYGFFLMGGFLGAASVPSAGDPGQEARSWVEAFNSVGSEAQIQEAKTLLKGLPTERAEASAELPLEKAPDLEKAAALGADQVPGPRCQAGSWEAKEDKAFGRPRALDSFYVFVTLSMGDETLRALSRDVQKIGGRLVIRGLLNNDFKATQARLAALKIAVDIDPPLFQKFEVTAVPTFIHVAQGGGSPDETLVFDRVRGNVTVAEALSQMKERGEVPGAHALLASFQGGES